MHKSRIFWQINAGEERDIPEKAVVTVENGETSVRTWAEGDAVKVAYRGMQIAFDAAADSHDAFTFGLDDVRTMPLSDEKSSFAGFEGLFVRDERVYVENVRAFFGTSTKKAQELCDQAVERGWVKRRCGVLCANSECQKMLFSFPTGDDLPPYYEIKCNVCEAEEHDSFVFEANELEKVYFYVKA